MGSSVLGKNGPSRSNLEEDSLHQRTRRWMDGWMDGTKRASSAQRGRHLLCEIGSGAWETFPYVKTDERQHR